MGGKEAVDLAYIQHFHESTPSVRGTFGRNTHIHDPIAVPAADIQMYRVTRQYGPNNQRLGDVVSLESLARFVQLIPDFGPRVKDVLTMETTAELCHRFYVNSFATLQIYQAVY